MSASSAIANRKAFIPYYVPSIGEDEIREVVDSLRSGWITTGPKVKRFEDDFARYVGAEHAIAVSSCTAALHIALVAQDIGPGDEVIVPTLTFCATANVVVHRGARPIIVDTDEHGHISLEDVERAITPRTRAVVPVHYAGQPCDLDQIAALASCRKIAVIEDAAHAAGAEYDNRKIGAHSPAVAFSFYATKNMTTGEGGMITTNDDRLADRMRLLALHGMSRTAWKRYTAGGSWYYEILEPGYKANMTDIQAALGIHQLRRLDTFTRRRRDIARRYHNAFDSLPELKLPVELPNRTHVYHLYAVQLNLRRLRIDRAQFIAELQNAGIGASVHFIPLHRHPFYRAAFGYSPGEFPSAERLYGGLLSLPLYPAMSEEDVEHVIDAVRGTIRAHRR